MFRIPSTILTTAAAVCTIALPFAAHDFPQSSRCGTPSSESHTNSYFPKGTGGPNVDFISSYLKSISEPSLLVTMQNKDAVSYRLICMYCRQPNLRVIRFTLNSDGSATLTTTTADFHASDTGTITDKAQHTVTVTSVQAQEFFQSVERANFWSMSSNEPQDPNPHKEVYKLDAADLVFEGVRKGAYHIVFREGPEPGPFTDMVRFLAAELAKADRSAIPQPSRSEPTRP